MIDRASINAISKATGISIRKTEKVSNNKIFLQIADEIIPHFNRDVLIKSVVKVFLREMNTVVQTPRGGILKIHDSLDFIFLDGSVIRYSSMGKDGLELTRIQVDEQSRGIGMGTDIMELTLSIFEEVLGYIPPITLECTGAVGIKHTYEETGLDAQIRFFQKFGFIICELDIHHGYALMKRPRGGKGEPPFLRIPRPSLPLKG